MALCLVKHSDFTFFMQYLWPELWFPLSLFDGLVRALFSYIFRMLQKDGIIR
jgi:hypothetical protein